MPTYGPGLIADAVAGESRDNKPRNKSKPERCGRRRSSCKIAGHAYTTLASAGVGASTSGRLQGRRIAVWKDRQGSQDMAYAPPSPCTFPGCPNLCCGPRCHEHAYDDKRPSASKRGYDRRWERFRQMKLRREPMCEECRRQGRDTPATDVDHIVSLARGGRHTIENTQSLCHSCHSQKTVKQDGGFGT